MSAPTRVKTDEYDWKRRSITSDFDVFLRISQYDDGYEEYEVGLRNNKTECEHQIQYHGYDLSSAVGDFDHRNPNNIAGVKS